ncbi:TldD/PmbA family protein [Halobacteriovorax sp. JY17]|uniref:TldD/PmbA family protein n=1 Tax=Halobacteriovorax sp. JY17 TaxID=2014617 RepID=UPI000C5BD23D|nr:TldD/PmbA family protein [Halobacteriovorax sp. JY17]PIK15692.1 MAG: Zn-dependent protease [Halobacteriovorax sp. JY17]
MEMQTLEKIIDVALKNGADQADIVVDSGESITVKSEQGEISSYEVSGTQVLGLRVIKDNKIGSSYCEATDDDTIATLVKQALENAKYSKEEELEKIDVQRSELIDGTKSFKYDTERTQPEKLIEMALMIEKDLMAKDTCLKTPPYNGVGEYIDQSLYLNHLGTKCIEKSKAYACYTAALLEKDGKQSMHVHQSLTRKFQELNPSDCIDVSYEHALGLINGAPVKTGHYDIVFSTDKLAQFFNVFASLFSAKAAINDMNPWKNKLSSIVASPSLTMTDAPLLEKGFAYSMFDGEGNMMSETPLIKDGVLTGFYQNSYTSKKLGQENTFNATRSPKSSLGVGGTNKVISPVEADDSSFNKGTYFEIIAEQGMYSGSDAISGDFSFAASGYLVENGERVRPIKGVTVSGNFYTVIKEISNIGRLVHSNTSATFFSPKIRFASLSVAGD